MTYSCRVCLSIPENFKFSVFIFSPGNSNHLCGSNVQSYDNWVFFFIHHCACFTICHFRFCSSIYFGSACLLFVGLLFVCLGCISFWALLFVVVIVAFCVFSGVFFSD